MIYDRKELQAPLSTKEAPEHRALNGQVAISTAAIDLLGDRDPTEDVKTIVGAEDPVEAFNDISRSKALEAGATTLGNSKTSQEALEDVVRVDAASASAYTRYRTALDMEDTYSSLSEEDKDAVALGFAVKEIEASLYEEEGFLGTAATWGGIMIPLRTGTLTDNLEEAFAEAGYLEDDTNWLQNQYLAGSVMENLREVYSALPDPSSKLKFAELLRDTITAEDGGTDNPMIGKDVFQAIIGSRDLNVAVENIFSGLDVPVAGPVKAGVTAATTATAAIKAVSKASRKADLDQIAIKVADNTGDAEVAKVAQELAQTNPELATAAGASPDRVENMLDPFAQNAYRELIDSAGADSNLPAVMEKYDREQTERILWYMKFNQEESVLSPARQEEVMQLVETKLALDTPFDVDSFKVVEKNAEGFKYQFKVTETDSEGLKTTTTRTEDYQYTWNDLGELVVDEYAYKSTGLVRFDANSRFTGDLKQLLVQEGEKNIREVPSANDLFGDLQRNAIKGLNKYDQGILLELLQDGGELGKVFTPAEIHKKLSIGSNKAKDINKVIESYYKMRKVADFQKNMKDREIIKLYKAENIKFYKAGADEYQPVKVYDDVDLGLEAYKKDDLKTVAVQGSDEVYDRITDEIVKDWDARGYKLSRTTNDLSGIKVGDAQYGWAFVKDLEVPSPGRVTGRVPGYFPRASKNGYYFLKRKEGLKIAGYEGGRSSLKTIAQSDGRSGLKAYLDKAEKEALEKGLPFNRNDYQILADQDIPYSDRVSDIVLSSGGLFRGSRTSREGGVPFLSDTGEEGGRIKAKASKLLDRMNANTGSVVGKSVRNARMEKHFLDALSQKTGQDFKSLNKARDWAESKGNTDAALKQLTRDAIDQIEASKGMSVGLDRAFEESMWALGQRIENNWNVPFIPNPSKIAYAMANGSLPVGDGLRALSFTAYLGAGNVSQLFVQASGLSVALLANPVQFSKAAPSMVGASILDMLNSNFKAQNKMLQHMRASGMGEYVDGYELWRKSSMYEGVVHMQDDVVSMFQKKSGLVGALQKANTGFYTQGELLNARGSFFTAVQKYKSDNKGFKAKNATQKDIDRISEIAENYRLNMSRGNLSKLQTTPGLNVTFQFWQVLQKFTTKIMPPWAGGTGEFTAAERSRLIFGTVALMGGYQSIPLGETIVNGLLQAADVDPAKVSEEEAVFLRYGALGYFMKFALGQETNIVQRVSLGFDIFKQVQDSFLDKDFVSAVLGPSAGIVGRGYNSVQLLGTALSLVNENEDITWTDAKLLAGVTVKSVAGLFSSTRAAQQYWGRVFGESAALRSVTGEYLLHDTTMNNQTEIAAFFAMSPMELTNLYDAKYLYPDSGMSNARGLDIDKSVEVVMQLISSAMLADKVSASAKSFIGGSGAIKSESEVYTRLANMVLTSYDKAERTTIFQKALDKLDDAQNIKGDIISKNLNKEILKMEEGDKKLNVWLSSQNNPAQREKE